MLLLRTIQPNYLKNKKDVFPRHFEASTIVAPIATLVNALETQTGANQQSVWIYQGVFCNKLLNST